MRRPSLSSRRAARRHAYGHRPAPQSAVLHLVSEPNVSNSLGTACFNLLGELRDMHPDVIAAACHTDLETLERECQPGADASPELARALLNVARVKLTDLWDNAAGLQATLDAQFPPLRLVK